MDRVFRNRQEAGRTLADRLAAMDFGPAPLVVVALPRGGVPVALEVARRLRAPMDLALVRKIGVPWHRELAMAAVVDGDPPAVVVEESVRTACGIDRSEIDRLAEGEQAENQRRRRLYLAGRPPIPVRGRTVLVVDDGLATGTSARAALRALRRQGAGRLVLAVPVAPVETASAMAEDADDVVCLAMPSPFIAVGAHYVDFHQVEDDEVVAAMNEVRGGRPERRGQDPGSR